MGVAIVLRGASRTDIVDRNKNTFLVLWQSRLASSREGLGTRREDDVPRISGDDEPGVQAVALTMRLIEHLVLQRKSVGVTALAEALGTTKSRISRHLHTLVELGFLAQDPRNERYQV